MKTKTETKYHAYDRDLNPRANVKTLDIHLSTNAEDLTFRVKRAFDLAKSSGHELTLLFSGGDS